MFVQGRGVPARFSGGDGHCNRICRGRSVCRPEPGPSQESFTGREPSGTTEIGAGKAPFPTGRDGARPLRENRNRPVHGGVRSPRPTEATWGLAGSVGEKATPRYGGRNFILGLQIYILWFILRVRPKISLPGSRARLCGQRGQSRRKAAVFRHFSGDPPGPGTFFPANPEKREDERHESHQAQRHGGGL